MAMPGRLDDYNLTRLNGFDVGEASGHKLQRLWRRLDFARFSGNNAVGKTLPGVLCLDIAFALIERHPIQKPAPPASAC